MENKSIAIFIDAENIPAKYAKVFLISLQITERLSLNAFMGIGLKKIYKVGESKLLNIL